MCSEVFVQYVYWLTHTLFTDLLDIMRLYCVIHSPVLSPPMGVCIEPEMMMSHAGWSMSDCSDWLLQGLSALISVMQWIMGAPGIMVLAKGTAVRNCSAALSSVHRWCGCVCFGWVRCLWIQMLLWLQRHSSVWLVKERVVAIYFFWCM